MNKKPIEPIMCISCRAASNCWCNFEEAGRDFKLRFGTCKKCAAARDKISASCKTNSTTNPNPDRRP